MELTQDQIDIILKRISREDDEKALKVLFDAFYGKLFETAKFYLNNYPAAQEVVSDVFIKFWNNRSNIENIENVKSYLFIAVKRQSLNYIRDNKKRMHQSLDEINCSTYIESRSPDKILLTSEFTEILNNTIRDLPSKCCLVYSLVKDDGMKYQEVADTLNISIKTVEMHVGKALKRIKIAFDNYQK